METGKWLYFRVLAEPNPNEEGRREWRAREVAERALALSGRTQLLSAVSTTLRISLEKTGLAERVRNDASGRGAVWALTEEV